jgi:hypothetical protein
MRSLFSALCCLACHKELRFILANDPAHRSFLNALFSFLGDPPIKGVLPGGEKFKGRLENIVKGLEQNWFIKLIAILAAIAGVLLFAEGVADPAPLIACL